MAEHILTRKLSINLPLETVFEFFSNAENLREITPPELDFHIVTPTPIDMKVGTEIDYKLKLYGIPFSWRTLITDWNPPFSFTDEALKGPYKQWIHRHFFTENADGGTDIKDEVLYRLPFEPFGDLIHKFIRAELDKIFDFRQRKVKVLLRESDHLMTRKQAA